MSKRKRWAATLYLALPESARNALRDHLTNAEWAALLEHQPAQTEPPDHALIAETKSYLENRRKNEKKKETSAFFLRHRSASPV